MTAHRLRPSCLAFIDRSTPGLGELETLFVGLEVSDVASHDERFVVTKTGTTSMRFSRPASTL